MWQQKGEPGKLDEPRQDLATGAGSIPVALQSRAGCEVLQHLCQGILCQHQGVSSDPSPLQRDPGRVEPPAQHCWAPEALLAVLEEPWVEELVRGCGR